MIVHFDLDAFYASVAQRDAPALRGKPVAVAGESRRAVVLTASYEARAFGVRSAIPLYRARELCPDLIVTPPDFARYREASRAVFAIFGKGARALEGLSLDEAYVSPATDNFKEAVAYAHDVRRAVAEEIGLTVSAGVSRRKLLAKIASDDAKPNGLRAVEPGSEASYLRPLPVGRLWGIGPKTEARLAAAGITRIGELADLADDALFTLFGRQGREVRDMARGNDDRAVESEHAVRSISSETTFERDLHALEELRLHLDALCEDIAVRLRAQGLRAQTIGVKCKRADFRVFGRQTTLAQPTDAVAVLRAAASHCLDRCGLRGEGIRLLGIRAGSLTEDNAVQLSLLSGSPCRKQA
jgi:DNA polymerase-4